MQLKVFNTEQMNQAVFAFRRYEDASLSHTGIESPRRAVAPGFMTRWWRGRPPDSSAMAGVAVVSVSTQHGKISAATMCTGRTGSFSRADVR